MSDIMSAIAHDIEMYELRCKKYNEEVQYNRDYYGNMLVNCYGEHAEKLRKKDIDK